MKETDVLQKFDRLSKEASERGLKLKYNPILTDGLFFLMKSDASDASIAKLENLDSVETFLKGYQEGYRGCVEECNTAKKDAGISGLYPHDFT